MLSYLRQVAICESVREVIKQALSESEEWHTKLKAPDIPTTDSVLRAVSVLSSIDSEEQLKNFIVEHIMASLHITTVRREDLALNN